MNRTIQFGIGLLAIVLALVAGFYGRSRYLKEVSTYAIPVPNHPIPAYTVLHEDLFRLQEMPRSMASLPYFQSVSEMNGKISTVSLPADLPIPQTNAVSVEQFRLADADLEVFSIPVEPVSAVGGQIRIGERVNLYQVLLDESQPSFEEAKAKEEDISVKVIARDVLVVDIRNAQGVAAEATTQNESNSSLIGGTQNEQVQILTLAVAPEFVDVILEAVAVSKKQGGLLWTSLALPEQVP
ncbi:MAG: RcpC/CpaB family pilus assembly protein [Chloroflexota bacterium]